MADDKTTHPADIEQMRAEFRKLLADTSLSHAQARKADNESFKAYQEGRFYPMVVFGAGSLFTMLLGAVIAAALKWAGLG